MSLYYVILSEAIVSPFPEVASDKSKVHGLLQRAARSDGEDLGIG